MGHSRGLYRNEFCTPAFHKIGTSDTLRASCYSSQRRHESSPKPLVVTEICPARVPGVTINIPTPGRDSQYASAAAGPST